MNINNLPENVRLQVHNLVLDEQFQNRFADDKILDYLQSQKHNKIIEFQQLQLLLYERNVLFEQSMKFFSKRFLKIFLHNLFAKMLFRKSGSPNKIFFRLLDSKPQFFIEGHLKPITLALYSYLYSIQSNVVLDMNKIDLVDLDVFFYLLETKDYNHDVKELFRKSDNYCQRVMNLTYSQVINLFNKINAIQFKVFSLFPRITHGDNKPIYNVDWVINIVSKVKPYTSYTTKQLYTEVPVMQIYYYYASYLRNNGSDSIFIRNEEEILDEMDSRMIELVVQRLIQKNVFPKEQKAKYFDLMKNKKENE